MKTLVVYCDGSSLGNPGKAGMAAILQCGSHSRTITKSARKALTNNQAELGAAIIALETLKFPVRVTIHTDSKYVMDNISRVKTWESNKWIGSNGKPIKNQIYWERLIKAAAPHTVVFKHVKAHSGDPLNERCDMLAKSAARLALID